MTGTESTKGRVEETNGAAAPRGAAGDSDSGRDGNGRFAKGNKLGTGNPFARLVAALRQRIIRRVTPADLDEIVDGLVISAKGGDLGATKLLLQYLVGKPAEVVNPDTLDLEEWQVRSQAPPREVAEAVMARVPLKLLSACANTMDMVQVQIAGDMIQASAARMADPQAAKAKSEAANPARPAGNAQGESRPITAKSLNAARLTAALGLPKHKTKPHAVRKESSCRRRPHHGESAAADADRRQPPPR